MKKYKHQSILVEITPKINETKSIQELKEVVGTFLNDRKIKDKDLIISNLNQITNYQKGIKYVYDSLLKFEGLGVV